MFKLPDDENLLAAVGKIALLSEHLNHTLKLMLMTFANVDLTEAMNATRYEGARALRERVKKLAKQKLGEGQALVKLQALVEKCGQLNDKRNELVHCIWGYELDGEYMTTTDTRNWKNIPTPTQLDELITELTLLRDEMITARKEGFIFDALNKIQ